MVYDRVSAVAPPPLHGMIFSRLPHTRRSFVSDTGTARGAVLVPAAPAVPLGPADAEERPAPQSVEVFTGAQFGAVFTAGEIPDREDFKDRFVAGLKAK